ncbi:MAG: formylglycine-generating enzyme family protein [Burkholderiales bacterium]|nr:formylglycine-generating enzyme family protein [Nitrosomonas sp.]MCP5273819.1 formylglycine-generating enzyme family protein [Burkholderiales bacterium]
MLWGWDQGNELPVYHPWNYLDDGARNAPVLPRLVQTGPGQQLSAALYLHTGRQRLCFEAFNPPDWAAAWGQDAFGLYADFKIREVTQRFRWIAPGTFLMGSPESEPERLNRETQHEVTLTQGCWLADTACTQALWSAVMNDNPAHFKEDMDNPVETVSWDDAQKLIDRLNHDYPDLSARLPTEAQWEYACRAGTTTPFSFGKQITPDQVNYDGNYPYAGGKKGQCRNKTVPVKSLPPNPWGLYEMHGNVWEWCADWYGAYPEPAVIDPAGPENGDGRVLRGGSWYLYGRGVRSAYRDGNAPVDRDDDIGFRLALGRTGVSLQVQEDSAEARAAAAEQEK